MEKLILKGAKVLNAQFDLVDADITTDGSLISEIGAAAGGGQVLDCSGCTIVPGFVDVHIHGAMQSDTCDASAQGLANMAAFLVTKGVTSFCPTTMTVSASEISAALSNVKAVMENSPEGAAIVGVNMEGPFISEKKKGAQKGEFVRCPDYEAFKSFYDACGGIIKLVDIAPECEGADDFICKASKLCTISIAHTAADFDCAKHAFELGITHATHLYNAMSGFTHRAPGVVGAVFDTDSVRAEIICDGIHIDPAVLRVTFKLMGEDRMVVISDAIRATGCADGESELGGQKVFVQNGRACLADGTLAGSTTNLHTEVKNLISYGVPFKSVMKAVSINPAKQIHEDTRIGSIAVSKDADLVVLDSSMDIKYVIAKGRIAYKA